MCLMILFDINYNRTEILFFMDQPFYSLMDSFSFIALTKLYYIHHVVTVKNANVFFKGFLIEKL